MINSKELRLLNLVKRGVNELEVNELEDYGIHGKPTINGWEEEDIDPIELSPEWLDKLGFEKGYCDEMEGYMKTFGGRVTFFLVEQPYTDGTSGFLSFVETNVGMGINSICLNPPEYVHQLMNLVYSLTGEELTIKN